MPLATVQSKGSDYAAPEGVPLPARLQAVTYRRTQFEYKPHHRAVQEGTAKVGEIGVVEAWRWEFEVVEGDHKGVRLFGETPPKITEPTGRASGFELCSAETSTRARMSTPMI
ncbi:MAG: hypothetical protein ACM4D3_24720 [Candidatus Sericytochromatia bacterium]